MGEVAVAKGGKPDASCCLLLTLLTVDSIPKGLRRAPIPAPTERSPRKLPLRMNSLIRPEDELSLYINTKLINGNTYLI